MKLVRDRGVPAGVVINKDGFGTADVAGFCASEGVPVIGRIGFLRERAATGAMASLWLQDPLIMDEMDRILAQAMAGARTKDAS